MSIVFNVVLSFIFNETTFHVYFTSHIKIRLINIIKINNKEWKIGNGMNIPIFEAPWLRNGGCISGLGQSSEVI